MSGRTDDALPPDLARALAKYIREAVQREVQATAKGEDWVPHYRWPCRSSRAACALARSGQLRGVQSTGRGRGTTYYVRREELDRWIGAQPVETPAGDKPADEFEAAMARSGLRKGGRR
jgi:hypothetical protein